MKKSKTKNAENKKYIFRSSLQSDKLIERIIFKSNLKFDRTNDDGFYLVLNSDYDGEDCFKANISTDEDGGCLITGEIVRVARDCSPKKKQTLSDKIKLGFSILIFVLLLPFFLAVILISYCICGLDWLYNKIRGKNVKKPVLEEVLINFFVNDLGCSNETLN